MHKGEILCVCVHGSCFFTGGQDGCVRKWDMHTREMDSCFHHSAAITCICACGNAVYTGTDGGVAHKWLWATGQEKVRLAGHSGSVTCIAVCANMVYTGSMDNTVRGWTDQVGSEATALFEATPNGGKWISCMCLEDDFLLAGADNGSVSRWNRHDGSLVATYEMHRCPIWQLRLLRSNNKATLISCSLDCLARTWELEAAKAPSPLLSYAGHKASITALMVFGSGAQMFTGAADGRVVAHRVADGAIQANFRAHKSSIVQFAEYDDLVLITFSASGEVSLWALEPYTGEGSVPDPTLIQTVTLARPAY